MAKCQFTTNYWNYESQDFDDYKCLEDEGTLGSGLCIFHDIYYLQDYLFSFREEKSRNVRQKLMDKVTKSRDQREALLCIGYYLPDITIKGDFTKPVYFFKAKLQQIDFSSAKFTGGAFFNSAKFSGEANFNSAKFSGEANFESAKFTGEAFFESAKFSGVVSFNSANFSELAYFSSANFSELAWFISAKFSGEANFESAKFSGEANFESAIFSGVAFFISAKFSGVVNFSSAKFSGVAYFSSANFSEVADFSCEFNGETAFNYVVFEDGKKILFQTEDLSKVSFANADITRVRFSETARWGERKQDKDRLKVIEERWLEESSEKIKDLEDAIAVYRNLRENSEFRLRYDEAGKFFIMEMELKRKYRRVLSEDGSRTMVKRNSWLRRNLSLTGLYYRLSNYGESIAKPIIIGAITVGLSTLFWLTQSRPTLEPTLNFTNIPSDIANHASTFILLKNATNYMHLLKAFERSVADFIPILSLGNDIKVGIIDYVIKIVGGALTFGLILIALRRKFERKYTR